MNELIPYIPASLILFLIGGLITVKASLKDRPTFHQARKLFMDKGVCEERSKNIKEKLECIPTIKKEVTEIKTTIDLFLEKNGGEKS